MLELIDAVSKLGDGALTAFIIYQVLNFVESMSFLGLCTWGVRSAWKVFKEKELS